MSCRWTSRNFATLWTRDACGDITGTVGMYLKPLFFCHSYYEMRLGPVLVGEMSARSPCRSMYKIPYSKCPAAQDIVSPTVHAHSLPWLNPNTQLIPPSHRSHFDSGCGCFQSKPDCVSCPHIRFLNLGFSISTAFAIITGVFRENKGRSWSHAANIAGTR